ncbi:hypothetical protein N473_17100 [Pseudoalteromonas luteoviolacea CPMOR-1]|uniref:Uncharacterized protein n=1 Tax=Pseudoalteromonas luteoviolacea CPMOR-1 TaxID=1365248 RepID=A0A162AY02_9GAMM|nr:hypothetical protein N473_17100 [Pseudoalteromonas luteoviolacea CPMOR-1]
MWIKCGTKQEMTANTITQHYTALLKEIKG